MTLIIPPLFDPTVPLLGPYQLAGFARKESLDFKVIDFNQKFVKHIIDAAKEPIFSPELDEARRFEIETCQRFLKSYNFLTYDEIKERMASCSSLGEYWATIDYLRACYDLFSLKYSGLRFRLDGFDTRYRWNIWSDAESFLQEFIGSSLFLLIDDWIAQHKCEMSSNNPIGINITFESQLFFAILFCISIQKHIPNAFIIVGGGFVNSFIDSGASIGPLAGYCDLVVAGEGEALLWKIKKLKLKGKDFSELQKLGQCSGKRAFFVAASNLCTERLDVYAPYFEGEILDDYLSPSKVIPLRFTYQCYWGKCKFCSDKESHSCLVPCYDFDEIVEFCVDGHRNGVFDCVYFLDSAIPAKMLEKFADALIEQGECFPWGTNVRVDAPFSDELFIQKLAQAGCVFMKFGLESGSQRVLDLMDKGMKVENAAKFVHLCRKYGIYVHAYVMFAFPGEKPEDIEKTREFLLSDYSHPDSYNCSEFILYGSASIANELNYSFDTECNEDGWHSASYSFSNDSIKAEISRLRMEFDQKFVSSGVLISTGHTISLSRNLQNMKINSIFLYGDSVLRLSRNVQSGFIHGRRILGRWRRRDGIVYIADDDVDIVLTKIVGFPVQDVICSGITTNTLFDLIDEGFLEIDRNGGVDCKVYNGRHQIAFHYGMEFSKMHWYGYYDMN